MNKIKTLSNPIEDYTEEELLIILKWISTADLIAELIRRGLTPKGK